MQRKLGFWLVLTVLTVPVSSRAETLGDVLGKSYEARGGLDKIKAVQSIRLTGKMAMGPGMEAPITLEWRRPDHLRMEFIIQGMTGTMAYDGKVGWAVMPFMGKTSAEKVPEEQLRDIQDQAD